MSLKYVYIPIFAFLTMCFMAWSEERKKKNRLNHLLRWRKIRDVYLEHKTEDIPDTVIHKKYIYPQFFISRRTLVDILGCPIDKQLKELGEKT